MENFFDNINQNTSLAYIQYDKIQNQNKYNRIPDF